MKNLKLEVIKYAKMLNSKKLSALRSGNISVRYKDGFLITPSGKKYSSLKNKDIVFVSLEGKFDKNKGILKNFLTNNVSLLCAKRINLIPLYRYRQTNESMS